MWRNNYISLCIPRLWQIRMQKALRQRRMEKTKLCFMWTQSFQANYGHHNSKSPSHPSPKSQQQQQQQPKQSHYHTTTNLTTTNQTKLQQQQRTTHRNRPQLLSNTRIDHNRF